MAYSVKFCIYYYYDIYIVTPISILDENCNTILTNFDQHHTWC